MHKQILKKVFSYKKSNVWYCNQESHDGFFDNYVKIEWDYTYTAGRRKNTKNGFEAKKAIEILIRNK